MTYLSYKIWQKYKFLYIIYKFALVPINILPNMSLLFQKLHLLLFCTAILLKYVKIKLCINRINKNKIFITCFS